jgi:hypothetical protein
MAGSRTSRRPSKNPSRAPSSFRTANSGNSAVPYKTSHEAQLERDLRRWGKSHGNAFPPSSDRGAVLRFCVTSGIGDADKVIIRKATCQRHLLTL